MNSWFCHDKILFTLMNSRKRFKLHQPSIFTRKVLVIFLVIVKKKYWNLNTLLHENNANISKMWFNQLESSAIWFCNGIILLRISLYAVLNAVFYSKRTLKECFCHWENKGKLSFNINRAAWATEATLSYKTNNK